MPPRAADERVSAQLAMLAPSPRQSWADDGPAIPAGLDGAEVPAGVDNAGAAPRDEGADPLPWPAGGHDPFLDGLIAQALRDNPGLREARARRDGARMEHGLARRRRWPTPGVAIEQHRYAGDEARIGGRRSQTSASLAVEQPVDLGGELARRAQAAHARTVALDFAHADARRRLVAEVSGAYWRLAYLRREAALRDAAWHDARRRAAHAETRHRLGETSGDDVAGATRHVAARQGARAAIAAEQASARHALNRLLAITDPAAGSVTGSVAGRATEAAALPEVDQLPRIDAGLPAALLSRRPDLRAREWRLREAARLVDAAHASFYPKLTLTGRLGSASDHLLQWLRHPVGTLIAGLSFPAMEWRVRQWRIGAADAQAQLALAEFARTLHQALGEVEDALSERRRYLAEFDAARTQWAATTRAADLACARYRAGETDIAPWLEHRAAGRDVEATLLRLRYDLAVNAVTLQQALGGDAVAVDTSEASAR